MTDEELEKLARMVVVGLREPIASELRPMVERAQELIQQGEMNGPDPTARLDAMTQALERASMPEVTALAERVAALEEKIEARLPRQPRPWHLKWWFATPPPKWWPGSPTWWEISLAATPPALLIGLVAWTTPYLGSDGSQWWLSLRLTWW